MMSTVTPALLICFALQIAAGFVEAYEEPTHQRITQLAVQASRTKDALGLIPGSLSLDDKLLDRSPLEWTELGAFREDALPRPLNHFHNPLTAWTVAGFGQLGQSSALWLQNPDQEWSWLRVRDNLHAALTRETRAEREQALAATLRGLGHLVHLVQDAASPAHVRNDPHPFGYQYEKFVLQIQNLEPDFVSQQLSVSVGPDPTWRTLAPNVFGPLLAALLIDAEQYQAADSQTGLNPGVTAGSLIGLAEYANANFLSEDTLWNSRLGGFKYPARTSAAEVDREIRLPSGEVVVRRYYQKVAHGDTGHLLATVGLLRDYYVRYNLDPSRAKDTAALDEMVYRDYARKLLPRALGYSIALIDDFFDGFLRATQFDLRAARVVDPTSGPDGVVIANFLPSGEEMEGRFEVYRDRPDDRYERLATWSLRVPPWGFSQIVQVPVQPYDPNLSCRVVFRGRVGQESDVVTISTGLMQCPMEAAPPPPSPICIPFCD